MAHCYENKSCEVTALRESHHRVLWIVLAINALMFMVEGVAGILAHSTSLLADALDMLGDALVYGFSLFVIARSLRWQGRRWQRARSCWSLAWACWRRRDTRCFTPLCPA